MTTATNTRVVSSDRIVRVAHLALVLGATDSTLRRHVNTGLLPKPDGIVFGKSPAWNLATIRAWNPDVATAVEALLDLPALNVTAFRPAA